MRKPKTFTYISFYTTTAAFATEKYCRSRGLPGKLVSVPREMSAGCGIAWRIPEDAAGEYGAQDILLEKLLAEGIEAEEIRTITH